MKTRDRVIGILVGLLLGLVIVTAFVFFGSESTIDAPGVNGSAQRNQPPASNGRQGESGKTGAGNPAKPSKAAPPKPATPPVVTVRVIGGAPPSSGPAHLDYPAQETVRLRVVSDETVGVELVGLGLSGTVRAGQPTLLRFRAKKPGNYPLIVTASHIAIAQIRIGEPNAP
jgi:hypothetical protein